VETLFLQPNSSQGCLLLTFQNIKFFIKMAVQITDASFEQDVLQSDKLTLVDFWAEWCGPCKMMNPVIEKLATEYEGKVSITKMDIDVNPETPTNFSIRGIPTIVMFKGGKEVHRVVGAVTETKLREQIEVALNKN
jgi:thioredoxin 1